MSSKVREAAALLKTKYVTTFRVAIELVEIREFDGYAIVSAPTRRDLPTWDTGEIK